MNKFTSGIRQHSILFVTATILFLLISFYFFFWVNHQEKELNELAFRVLARTEKNFIKKLDDYKSNALLLVRPLSYQKSKSRKYDSYYQKKISQIFDSTKARNEAEMFDDYKSYIQFVYFFGHSVKNEKDVWRKISGFRKNIPVLIEDSADIPHNSFSKYSYGFTFSAGDFIKPFLRNEAFKEYALFRDNNVLYSSLPGLRINQADSLLLNMKGIKTSRIVEIQVAGVNYKAFLHPIKLSNTEDWILCGLMPSEDYVTRKMNISSNVVLYGLLLIFLFALSLPFLKMYMISPFERQKRSDVIVAAFSLILGTSLLTLTLFDTYHYLGPYKNERSRQLKNLSSRISESFLNEISGAYKQLSYYDSIIPKISSDVINIRKTPQKYNYSYFYDDGSSRKLSDSLKLKLKPVYYPEFNSVSWIDANGYQIKKWFNDSDFTRKIDVSQRNYYKDLMNHKFISLNHNDTSRFAFEALYSWTTGEYLSIISKRSRAMIIDSTWWGERDTVSANVVAISSRMYSVMDPVLPQGFGFCIAKSTGDSTNGDIVFHSDKSLNLKENILKECGSPILRSAFYARSNAFFKSTYQGENYRFYITPIKGLPFSLLVFHAHDYSKSDNAQVISMTLIFILLYFLFICIQAFVMNLLDYRSSKLKIKHFYFEWLWPTENRNPAYYHALISQLLQFLLLVYFINYERPLQAIVLLFISSVYRLFFTYFFLSWDSLSLSLKWKLAVLSLFFVVIANGLSILLLENIREVIYFQAISLLVFFLFHFLAFSKSGILFRLFNTMMSHPVASIIHKKGKIFFSKEYKVTYATLLLCWLFLTSVYPVIVFFRISCDQQAEYAVRHNQAYLADKISENTRMIGKKYRFKESRDNKNNDDIYSLSCYNTQIDTGRTQNLKKEIPVTREDSLFRYLVSNIRPVYNSIARENNHLVYRSAADSLWLWKKRQGHLLTLRFNESEGRTFLDINPLNIVSTLSDYKLPAIIQSGGLRFQGLFFWICVIVFIFLLYLFIRFIMHSLFIVDLLDDKELIHTDSELLKMHESTGQNLFLIGLPFSGKSTYIDNKYPKNNDRVTIDTIFIREEKKWEKLKNEAIKDNTLTIIDHFEYAYEDLSLNGKKLDLIESLVQVSESKKIIIVSTLHPMYLLDIYKTAINESKELDGKNRLIRDMNRWIRLLSNFYKLYYPLQGYMAQPDTGADEKVPLLQLIEKECNHGSFMRGLKPMMVNYVNEKTANNQPINEEELILNLQSMASVYYASMWAALSQTEKYLVYDLAQDGLINGKNFEAISLLLKKGIFLFDGKLKIMSESFRNYVLSVVNPDEALIVERESSASGTWAKFRTPAILVLIVIGVFVFATQKETYSNIISFLTIFLGVSSQLPKLLSLISGKSQQAGA